MRQKTSEPGVLAPLLPRILIVGRGALGSALQSLAEQWLQIHNQMQGYVESWSPSTSYKNSTAAAAPNSQLTFEEALSSLKSSEFGSPTHIWLAIPESKLEGFIARHHKQFDQAIVTHFSGALGEIKVGDSLIHCAHPLFSFQRHSLSQSPLNLDMWAQIPFCVAPRSPPLNTLLPPLTDNPKFVVPNEQKTTYHALMAMAVALQVTAWDQTLRAMRNLTDGDFSSRELMPLMRSVSANIQSCADGGDIDRALTGPLNRKDWSTVARHLEALREHSLALPFELYQTVSDHLQASESQPRKAHFNV